MVQASQYYLPKTFKGNVRLPPAHTSTSLSFPVRTMLTAQ